MSPLNALPLRLLACAALALASALGARAAEPGHTNVLIIYIDDLRPALGAYQDPIAQTPSIDRLAASGVIFQRAYCQYAVCGPSRSSTLFGLGPDQLRAYGNNAEVRDIVPNAVTLPQLFKQAGYETISIGKVFDWRMTDPQSWTERLLIGHGDSFYATRENIEQQHQNERMRKAGKALSWSRGPAFERAGVGRERYQDEHILDAALEKLEENAGKPFFLAVGFHKPHLPFCAPAEFWDRYERDAIPVPPMEQPRPVSNFAFWNWLELRSYKGIPKDGQVSREMAAELIHGYYASTSFIDDLVGRLLNRLDALELDDETLVVLLGDHGFHLGEQAQWCKYVNTELANHSPLIMRFPHGRHIGRQVPQIVEFLDLYPTIARAAGLQPPADLPGSNLLPLLENDSPANSGEALSQTYRQAHMGYTLRVDRYRYTAWRQQGKIAAEELYDYELDPREMHNQATAPGYRLIKESLRERMESLIRERGGD